eukprot:3449844-Amphidinium_carterae.2
MAGSHAESFALLQVFKLGLAKSIHHARVLIRQRHIRVGKQIVNVPSFLVRMDLPVQQACLKSACCEVIL